MKEVKYIPRYTIQDYTKDKMAELGLNQNKLAKKLGVSRVSVHLFLKGKNAISLEKLYGVIGKPDLLWESTCPEYLI